MRVGVLRLLVFSAFLALFAAASAIAQTATTAIFPQVVVGGGYSTVFTLLNTGPDPASGTLILKDKNGADMSVNLLLSLSSAADPRISEIEPHTVGSVAPVAVKSGGMLVITATPLSSSAPQQQGWAHIESSGGSVSGVATFLLSSSTGALQSLAGVLGSAATAVATIPVDNDGQTRFTGFAIANPSQTDTINVRVVPLSTDGFPQTAVKPISLGPLNQTAGFLAGADYPSLNQFRGSVAFLETSGKPFAIVALVVNSGLLTAIPVVPAKAPIVQ